MSAKPIPGSVADRNLRRCFDAAEAIKAFVARKRGVGTAEIFFADLPYPEHLVNLLVDLRHWGRHVGVDYAAADRLARRRYAQEFHEEVPQPHVQE